MKKIFYPFLSLVLFLASCYDNENFLTPEKSLVQDLESLLIFENYEFSKNDFDLDSNLELNHENHNIIEGLSFESTDPYILEKVQTVLHNNGISFNIEKQLNINFESARMESCKVRWHFYTYNNGNTDLVVCENCGSGWDCMLTHLH